jgi:hypothetical protein
LSGGKRADAEKKKLRGQGTLGNFPLIGAAVIENIHPFCETFPVFVEEKHHLWRQRY